MADVKLTFVNSDSDLEEIGLLDVALVKGIKTTESELTLEDGDNGQVTLSDLLRDELVKVSVTDTIAGYLADKILSGVGIIIVTITDSFGEETLQVSLNAGIDDLNDVDTTTIVPVVDDVLVWDGSNWVPSDIGDIPDVNTYSFSGGIQGVGGDRTEGAEWGRNSADAGIDILEDGEIKGISISLNQPRTTGTLTCMLVINGIAQNGAGETFDINAVNPINNQLVFTSPISVSQGDVVTMQTVTVSFKPTGADAVLAFWGRNT